MTDFTVRDIVPGVYAALGGVCNRGIVAHEGHVLVVDSGISGVEAEPLRADADAKRGQGSMVLFNTHPHGDHVYGNQVFADVPIVSHSGVRDNLRASGEQVLAMWRQNPNMGPLISDVRLTPPTVTFDTELCLTVGGIDVHLLYCGVAHSPSDSVAWLPQVRTLFAGDLLFNEVVPAMPPGGNQATWIGALERLEGFGAEHVIPGHGPIQSPEALGELRAWMIALRERVGDAIGKGLVREEAIARVTAEVRAEMPRTRDERLPGAVAQVFDEVTREWHGR